MIALLLAGCASDAALSSKLPEEPDAPPDAPAPYEGGWERDQDCEARIAQDNYGNDEGDTPPDFALLDQYGEQVRLHDFCDHVLLLVWAGFT